MKRKALRLACFILCIGMVFSGFTGCGGGSSDSPDKTDATGASEAANTTDKTEELTLLEYNIFLGQTSEIKVDNPNDVVTPYVEDKFKIKVKEIIQPQQSVLPKDKLNMMIAAGTVPDTMIADGAFATYALSTGYFLDDIGSLIKENMPNYNKYFDESKWVNASIDGKIYGIPCQSQTAMTDEIFKDDPYYAGFTGWAYWVREDILAKAGYKFTPIADLKKNITDQGKVLTLEDMKIEPAIDTPEQWVDMLKKIKALDLKVGNKSVIPMSIGSWNQFHIGNMYGMSQWKLNPDGKVSGFLGNPEAKDWYKLLWQLYQDQILDKDFLIHKDDQLQSKIASGLVASGMLVPDILSARKALMAIDPAAEIRYIPWPKKTPGVGSFDVMNGGMNRMIINKSFKDVKRLLQYIDWFYSEEGFDICTWGPESAGLWEMKDGKKVYKEAELAEALANGGPLEGKKGPEYYGLITPYYVPQGNGCNSRNAIPGPTFNPSDARHSYNTPLDIYTVMQILACRNGINSDGKAAYDDGGANTSAVGTYYWGKFQNDRVGKIFAAKTEEEFNKAWDEQYSIFVKETNYEAAIADMTKFFNDTLEK